jgi:hypothetical protein
VAVAVLAEIGGVENRSRKMEFFSKKSGSCVLCVMAD